MDGMSWIGSLSDTFGDWLEIAVDAGAYAGLLAIVVLAINLLFRRWLSAGQMGLLWGLVLLRLVVPLAPGSLLSLANLVTPAKTQSVDTPTAPQAELPVATGYYGNAVPENVRQLTDLKLTTAASGVADESTWLDTLSMAFPLVWFIGGAAGLIYTLANYVRFCQSVNRVAECGDARLLRLWAECSVIAGVKRRGRIVQFDGVEQPAIMGVFHPTLLLPANAVELDDEQLRMVMLHELAHVRRWDIAVNWALVAIRAIHWWNPVYWLAAARFRSLREQACDAFVVRRLEKQAGQGYGALLLTLAERRPIGATWRVMLQASILSFFPSLFRRRAVRVRLKALRSASAKRGRWQSASVAALLIALAVCGFTVAREEIEKPMDLPTWMASHPDAVLGTSRLLEVKEAYAGPPVTREYDVAKVLKAERDELESNSIGKEGEHELDSRQLLENDLRQMYGFSKPGGDAFAGKDGENQPAADPKDAAKTAAESSGPTFKIIGTTLTAIAPVGLHERLRRMLDAWGESGMAQITIETRFVSSNRDLVSDLGFSWKFLETFSAERKNTFPAAGKDGAPVVRAEASVEEYLPLVVSTLNEQQTAKLIDIAARDRRTNVLSSPKVTIFNGTEAMIAEGSQRPFVVGMFQRAAGTTEPKIVVLEEGTKINVHAVVGHDRKKVHVAASVEMKSVGDVTTASTSYRGSNVSIQVPSVKRRSIDVAADVEGGQTLLVGCIPTGKEQQYLYYLLSARRISETELTTARVPESK